MYTMQSPSGTHGASDTVLNNILPELLLGMMGHTGGAFVVDTQRVPHNDKIPAPHLSTVVDWVTPAEREQLDRIVWLGHHYAQMESFVDSLQSADLNTSAYSAAFAHGVEELLDVYRSAILKTERRFQVLPTPPLLALQQFFSEFQIVFPEVAAIVEEVRLGAVSAPELMSLLDRRTRSGIPAVQSCACRLLWHCHQVMFKHLESWVLHGELIDVANEFFIQQRVELSSKMMELPAIASLDSEHESLDKFYVAEHALPPGVSPQTASSILFTGKAIRILRQAALGTKSVAVAQQPQSEILLGAKMLQELRSKDVIRPAALRFVVEIMQTKVSGVLWDLVCRRCDLTGYMMSVQAYLLLGRGDLYQQLLQNAAALLEGSPRPSTAGADMAQAFINSANQSIAESDVMLESFTLRWFPDPHDSATVLPGWYPLHDSSLHVPSYDAWDGLCLEMDAKWPLQLLFPPEVLRQYCALWQFMFRLKRVQADLEVAWASIAALGRCQVNRQSQVSSKAQLPRPALTLLAQVRQRMAHFAASLAVYLRVDVIKTSADSLGRRLSAAEDFTVADSAHRETIIAMTSGACLDVRQLMAAVENIFGMCRRLCVLVKNLESEEIDQSAAKLELFDVDSAFRMKHNLVFQLLQSSTLQSGPRAAALRQLVLRLNFNEFCEKEAMQQVRAVTAASSSMTGSGMSL